MNTTEKSIYSLIPDIRDVIVNGKKTINSDNLKKFTTSITKEAVRFLDEGDRTRKSYLRMSNIGREDRKLWYEINSEPVQHPPEMLLKFFYDNIVEALLLFLAAEAGHTVEDEQKEVELKGIKGHIDAKIDGCIIDIKSASNRGFRKFKQGTLFEEDAFGYVGQISGYMEAEDCNEGGFLAYDKSTGDIALLMIDELTKIDASSRIDHLKKVIELDNEPERCYEPVPMGTSGNYILDFPCRYCDFKTKCWKDVNNGSGLRKFKYSSGIKYFTNIVVEPKVEELF
mgnify:FL=1